jgi:hypothetical protein
MGRKQIGTALRLMVVKEEMNKFAIDYHIALGWIAATLIHQIGRVIIDG